MKYSRLIERLEIWEDSLQLLRKLQPNRLYKFTKKWGNIPLAWWSIVIPKRYSLVHASFCRVAGSTERVRDETTILNYSYIVNHIKIEKIKKKDLPLYLNSPFVGLEMERILKGKRKLMED